ncbi:hypothetical protein M758_9G018100 [Ceratodon purpureus]|uniref:RNA uridylyltransferase n=1 Tax=Ceratodon purpureus TaxID=3225 RepID=A0A8T0GQY4_CERPU|nr:hypothetical protein KC19_9G018300 [Ceratodon purpureus]KAG0604905.1 hypothetical protein M758_9G018100 [Ceratodon purpureus]
MNPSPPYQVAPSFASPSAAAGNLGVIGESSARHHGMEPKGEFLLQLLQGGGVGSGASGRRLPQQKANGEPSILEEFPHGVAAEEVSSAWQHRDPAVAALGPSHSYHGGEMPSQLLQPNQLFMPPQYGGGGVWTPQHQHQQQQQQQQQQQHQFFSPSHDPRGFGPLHARGPHQLLGNQFPPYPPPPSAQLTEPPAWRSENSMLDFSRRSEASWLPPPHARQGVGDGAIARAWSGPIQGNMMKSPLPPPLPPPPIPSQQQFVGSGAELMQLLLGGGSQNTGPQSSGKTTPGGVGNPGFPEELFGEGLIGGIQVDNVLPRAQVHGPIGPPKRNEAAPQPEQSSAGGEDLLGRFWATASSLANGSPEPSKKGKPNLSAQEEQLRKLSLGGGKEGPGSPFEGSKPHPQRTYGFSPDQSKPKVGKPPGFFGERDQNSGVSSTVKALNRFSDFPGVAKGSVNWEKGTADVKQEIAGRASDDRGFHQMPQSSSRFVGAGRSREDGYQSSPKTSGQIREDPTNLSSADFSGNEMSTSRELGRIGGRGVGRRGGSGRAEMGRSGGRMSGGQWVAVNEKQRERDGEREGVDALADRGVSSSGDGSSYSSPQTGKPGASGKDDSPNGSGGKSKEDIKRRRGQIQEWRMKQASPPHSKGSEPGSGTGSSSQQDGYSEGILPLASQVDRPGLPSNMVRHSMPGSATDESKQQLQYQMDEGVRPGGRERAGSYVMENGRLVWEDGVGAEEEEDLMRELNFSGYAKLIDDTEHFSTTPPNVQILRHATRPTSEETELEGRHENLRDSREVRRLQQRPNVPTSLLTKGDVQRLDLETFNPQLISIYKSLIPSQEEVQKQRKFLTHLDRLVTRDWGGAKLFLFGSCANDFGVCNSDIDVCLSVDDEHSSKAELVMRMAGILRSDDMQNVQALTHARVPIVKFTDPDTGINCDICVNNMLAVVNSKLLHDYSQVDPRLRQLAFLVKHWAKQRQVNETYRGTLSSYAYVLMCIHFLQQRRPAILPCLQKMQPTYEVTVGKIKCAYFDKVNTLKNFGTGNKESIAELLTCFFEYWASFHDYNHAVISVRTGSFLSKDEKDWTRRIGNERHLICIEDPFEITHDLGRVVDRHSIRVLRDEFKRAARILRQGPNPAVALFEPFIREKV